jgi:multimeric flavodoxin WrbA
MSAQPARRLNRRALGAQKSTIKENNMKVIGISGSPRKSGNSEILLQHALEPFKENKWDVVPFLLSEKDVAPCTGCDDCSQSGKCTKKDDMDLLYKAFATCDAVIIASPVYYRNVTSQLKAVIDRSYATRDTNPLKGKVGGAIAVGRGSGGGQSIVLNVIYNYFLSSGTICVPGELNGVSAVADQPGDILKQPKRLEQARILGENVLRYASIIIGP